MFFVLLNFLGAVCFIFLSAFFSASETALFSIPREKINSFKHASSRKSHWIYALLIDGQRTLLLIVLANLFVNITVIHFLYVLISFWIPGNKAIITSIVSTVILLFLGDILPKSIALKKNEKIASFIAPVLYHLKFFLSPVLFFMQKINLSFLLVFSRHLLEPGPYITMEEYKGNAQELMMKGNISENEHKIIERILEVGAVPVKKIMAHRSQLIYCNKSDSIRKAIFLMKERGQSVCCVKNSAYEHNIAGLLYLIDALKQKNQAVNVSTVMADVAHFPESTETANLIGIFFNEKHKNVCIHDEFGSFSGILSLGMCMEYIFKISEKKNHPHDYDSLTRKFDGLIEITMIKEWIPPSLISYSSSVRTLNGLLISYLGRIPENGEVFTIDGWTFYIIAAEPNKIKSVLIKKEV